MCDDLTYVIEIAKVSICTNCQMSYISQSYNCVTITLYLKTLELSLIKIWLSNPLKPVQFISLKVFCQDYLNLD